MPGTVRHNGIIPRDDDIDIMIPRDDYNQLINYFIDKEDSLLPYKLFCKRTNKNYLHMIARISDQRYGLDFGNEKVYATGKDYNEA